MNHRHSDLGDSREQAVMCLACMRLTWNVCGLCPRHCDHVEGDPPDLPKRGPRSVAALRKIGQGLRGEEVSR